MEVQISGVPKSSDTRTTLRFFAERRIRTRFVDLQEGPASSASLDDVEDLVVTKNGLIHFTEAGNRLPRTIGSTGSLHTSAGRIPAGQRQ